MELVFSFLNNVSLLGFLSMTLRFSFFYQESDTSVVVQSSEAVYQVPHPEDDARGRFSPNNHL